MSHSSPAIALPALAVALVALAPAAAQRSATRPSDHSWFDTLPAAYRQSILWSASHEVGTLYEWDFGGDPNAGGGVFNTGGDEVVARATTAVAHSGLYSAEATITNAYRARNGSRAVRLMRWTDTHWGDGGDYFPDRAYYSTWVCFPRTYNPNKYAPWDPGDGGWWNVFQFKANDANGVSQPLWTLDVGHDDASGEMSFYLYSRYNPPHSFGQVAPRGIPVGEWMHIEALYEVSSGSSGRITIWQDGVRILDVPGVRTVLAGGDEKPIWGIGNYTDHIDGGPIGGEATLYFDDAAVGTRRLSELLTWRDLGHGLGGSTGEPELTGHGTLTVASPIALSLRGAAATAPAVLIFGAERIDVAFLGGTLVPLPQGTVGATISANGTARWPLSFPPGLDRVHGLLFQAWILDSNGPAGATASNALAVTGR